ncbi:hypothetical protein IU486_11160 [Streptomyces gardneri]|uniref:hypothetical protein n=2 Tax=Nocardiaceae TaxID=85025 RepID=UPI0013577E01|nr:MULTISPECIES: hypothetical protein [Nocardia]MBF6165332.1 hypothetical protein [Streptomyces gardneri]
MRYNISRLTTVLIMGAVIFPGFVPAVAAPTPVKAKACDFTTVFGRPTLLHPVIYADVKATCDVPPESHTLELSLEHYSGGQWARWALQVDSGIPSRAGRETRVSAECAAGEWRHKVHVYGKLRGLPFDYTEVGDTRTVTSKECPRG